MKASPSAQRRQARRALKRQLLESPVVCSAGVYRDVMRYARLRGLHPFWRKRPERMAGK